MSSKKRSGDQDMEKVLEKFKNKELNPTAALLEPFEKNKSIDAGNKTKILSDIVKKRKKVEETHTRRTFLVKNELLKRLDDFANEINNTGFKTEFINYIIEKGLNELEEVKVEK